MTNAGHTFLKGYKLQEELFLFAHVAQLQGSYAVLFCPFFLLRTIKTQNVLLSHFKDTLLSF